MKDTSIIINLPCEVPCQAGLY